jgi:hypothetical protein
MPCPSPLTMSIGVACGTAESQLWMKVMVTEAKEARHQVETLAPPCPFTDSEAEPKASSCLHATGADGGVCISRCQVE